MRDFFSITGGKPLAGAIRIGGAKNAALPIMVASLLSDKPLNLARIPVLSDCGDMARLLSELGVDVKKEAGRMSLHARDITSDKPNADYVGRIRASVLLLGALLARTGRVEMVPPGGDVIGARPVNLHLMVLQEMGGMVEAKGGLIHCHLPKTGLCGAKIHFPSRTVGATETALMVACLARGDSELHNAAEEPEVMDLAACLNKMGAAIHYVGDGVFHIEGGAGFQKTDYEIIPDRIEAGSFAMALAAVGGDLTLEGFDVSHLSLPLDILRRSGVEVATDEQGQSLRLKRDSKKAISPIDVVTAPWPGFPTDLQAQFMALMCLADGRTQIEETIFENRFHHAEALNNMGGKIRIDGNTAHIEGGGRFRPMVVEASDIRACFSLIIAALSAEGESHIYGVRHIDRGYEFLEKKLRLCGAVIERKRS